MLSSRETLGQNVLARLAMVGLVSGALAGCSSDSARFSSTPGPMASQGSPEVTGSLGAAPTGRVDSAPIASAPLAPAGPPVAYAAPPPPPSGGQPLYGAPNYGAATYAAAPAQTHTAARGASHVVTSGETLTSVAQSYGMTRAHLAQVNGLSPDAQLKIGQTLVVPPGTAGNLAQIRPAPAAAKPSVVAAVPPPAAAPAAAPKTVVAAKPATVPAAPAPVVTAATPAVAPAPAKVASAAAPAKVETAAKVTPADDADDSARTPGSGPQFRAPVRGRVISGFGPKPGGTRNDGVNFAVPEGTGVRAAEDGTVAYAGNELKGYGNLVLIKHADGYVTAYAHNSELMVKRGDTVRRGQIVAKAGQSGGVSTPQLHFEIRKGSQPVDPSQYVAGL
ncbi:peptidoglycan DD-metalloendopeptidase family protein [Roseixanthobacter pseudopolyaromaticivorans]|uniref:peptidoglycan DD-metalloendopeptidase family protein n=1 Tax=Xanthobacteraceae TaxID=335928 RepID=UPI00372BE69E